ncbi:Lysophospholipase nte-1 [Taphrina deformans PYCC 5710]|uniref:Lysophospholipase nte-1 n=1 Tax=Taphrina deformans (strain PYCC 5710 / ATCC 11124 / CBS 356.35 / IMI 108563 / JCM 9778 / NBRC 8474) TaxID=1097556 RepID=R4X6G2_TAPDE|nr:Lysophospholipase nte-1 [Taphrina deformans PYCC 5710]|eukprot:CCG80665.1 Lysophospholipase nte-1 [Taphrina deformans PYCC 5710]
MPPGDTLSGFWAIFNRWNPMGQHPNIPTLTDIQSRLAYSASVPALVKAKDMSIYMRPPVGDFGTLEFGSFQLIYDIGYKYAKNFLRDAESDGILDSVSRKNEGEKHPSRLSRRRSQRSEHRKAGHRRNSL